MYQIFAALSPKHCVSKYGPKIAHAIQCWQLIETLLSGILFRNSFTGWTGKPIIFPQWSEQAMNILSDLMDGDDLCGKTHLIYQVHHSFSIPKLELGGEG